MLNEKVAKLLNEQVNKEFYSAYLYLSFSNFYKELGLDGFANWYHVQAQEERDHAMLFIQYMQNNDVPVTLEAIDKPGPLCPWYWMTISGCFSRMDFTKRPSMAGRPMPAMSFRQISGAPAATKWSASVE